MCHQVLKHIKLLEGIGNGGNGALIWRAAILLTNDQHFILLRSVGVYGKLSSVEHLQIYISCPCRRISLYRPMLILVCLTGVSGLIYVSGCCHTFLWQCSTASVSRLEASTGCVCDCDLTSCCWWLPFSCWQTELILHCSSLQYWTDPNCNMINGTGMIDRLSVSVSLMMIAFWNK